MRLIAALLYIADVLLLIPLSFVVVGGAVAELVGPHGRWQDAVLLLLLGTAMTAIAVSIWAIARRCERRADGTRGSS